VSDDNVKVIGGGNLDFALQRQITASLGDTLRDFQDQDPENRPATGAVWVVFNDAGDFRSGWDTRNSALPSSAAIGIGIAALTSKSRT
jgi:hypothetical protein